MGEETLKEKVIEREGVLRKPVISHSDNPAFYWVDYKKQEYINCPTDKAIAETARQMGYGEGDTVKYKIIIEPPKRD